MPRHFLQPKPLLPARRKLIDVLARELKATASDRPMPYVLEEPVPGTDIRTVSVIWDQWDGIPDGERAAVIIAAYREAEGQAFADTLGSSVGLTPPEALALGYMPYKLVAERIGRNPSADLWAEPEFKLAFKKQAAKTVLGRTARELRYPRLEDAEVARHELANSLPDSKWLVVEEQAAD